MAPPGRAPWTFSPHGDATRTGTEPLIVSEFGVWGLPHLADIREKDGTPLAFTMYTNAGNTVREQYLAANGEEDDIFELLTILAADLGFDVHGPVVVHAQVDEHALLILGREPGEVL